MPELLFKRKLKSENGFVMGKIDITTPMDKSLASYFQIKDTLDSTHNDWNLVRVEGLGFQFTLRIHRDSVVVETGGRKLLIQESRIPPYPLWTYDITSLNADERARISGELREMPYDTLVLRQAFQTCISYAIESIFRSHGIETEPFFFRRSVQAEADDLEKILQNLFVKVETLDNVRKSTLKRSKYLYADQVFILFRNIQGKPIHAFCNLKGRSWTKNGMSPYASFPTPLPVIDSYNSKKEIGSNTSETGKEFFTLSSVQSIEIYRLNVDIFK